MARTAEALVEASVLLWARTSIHYDVAAAAKRAAVSVEKLESWESGAAKPTIAQLRKLAEVYKRPLAVFFLPAPPKDFSAMKDFRAASERPLSPELAYTIRRAHERREGALELARDLDYELRSFAVSASVEDDPEKIGGLIRAALGVSVAEQFSWATATEAVTAWRASFERVGVLVFETQRVDLEECRGFSLSEADLPAVVINGQDAINGRIFTLHHEAAHIALRRGGLCDTHDKGSSASTKIETFCNRVAAAALMPRRLVEAESSVKGKNSHSSWDDPAISKLAKRYCVSKEAVLRRLVDLGFASPTFYHRMREHYLEEWRRARARQKSKKGGPAMGEHEKAVKYNGAFFARLVMTAYHRESITAVDAWNYLNLKPKHFDKLEAEVFRQSA